MNDIISVATDSSNDADDITAVLMSLGFSQAEAKKAIEGIDMNGKTENQIIKEALKKLNK